MSKTKNVTEQERAQIAALGLNPDAPAFGVVMPERKKAKAVLAPEGVDPHLMDVSDIVFDLYKSPHKNKDRHRRLQDEIGLFILRVRRSRESGVPHVKEQVRKTGKQRDLLALLAEHGITSVDDLAAALGGAE